MRLRDLASLATVCALLAACGKEGPSNKASPGGAAHEEHAAPHGGALLELGEEEAHLEVVHDAKAGVVTLYVYGKDLGSPVAVAAPTILVKSAAGAPKELTATALDAKPGQTTATAWSVTDPALAVDPLDGRVRLTIAGKQYQSPLEPAGHGD